MNGTVLDQWGLCGAGSAQPGSLGCLLPMGCKWVEAEGDQSSLTLVSLVWSGLLGPVPS